jgi:hypothetical protein
MTKEEVKKLADRLLAEDLGKFGFREVEVSTGEDEDGDEFFDISAHFNPSRTPLDPRASIRATSRLRKALLDAGENRFPSVLSILPETNPA